MEIFDDGTVISEIWEIFDDRTVISEIWELSNLLRHASCNLRKALINYVGKRGRDHSCHLIGSTSEGVVGPTVVENRIG